MVENTESLIFPEQLHNSGIDTVGVLTQYRHCSQSSAIGIESHGIWTERTEHYSSPYRNTRKVSGTQEADAVYQNIHYVDKLDPEYVIILSGDHIYKMDYSKMLDFHKKNNADGTISVINVPIEEANRYGIMNAAENGKIFEFEEKPSQPKSTLASMGVYIFNWCVLKKYLIDDHQNEQSDHDFGKNIIPKLLADKRSIWAYPFIGYWRDVGTIQAYWESNLDLVTRIPQFNLFDPYWKIYTPNPVKPAHYIGETGHVTRSIIAEGCMIYGQVKNSVIFPGVIVEKGSYIEDSIIMSNSIVKSDSIVICTIVGERTTIGSGVKTGTGEYAENTFNSKVYQTNITVIGSSAVVPDNITIGKNVVLDNCLMPEDFKFTDIPSGSAIIKEGVEHE